jgi:hypothetical protein
VHDQGLTADELARLIALTDHFRFPTVADAQTDRYKEWYHFCVLGPDVQVIINLNLSSDRRLAEPHTAQVARVILLVREGAWDGDIDTLPQRDVLLDHGQVDLYFGHNSVRFRDGVFDLSIALQNRPIALMLQLRPIALPFLLHNNVPMAEGEINWLVVPRLVCNGTITIGRKVHTLYEAPAYHDHNWGRWLWGQDFAWQWGFALPAHADIPWSMVFDCLTSRTRNQVLELSLWLWKGTTLHRFFGQREIQVRPTGYLAPARIPKFPRVMALIAPQYTTEVPRNLHLAAMAGDDHLHGRFEAEDVAQIIIPNEIDLGVTIINEVSGHLELEGKVRSESVGMQGRAIFEVLT